MVPLRGLETREQSVTVQYGDRLSSDDDAPSTPGSDFSVRDEEFYDSYNNLYATALPAHDVYRG